jgi:hypothetical protein
MVKSARGSDETPEPSEAESEEVKSSQPSRFDLLHDLRVRVYRLLWE